ncbi:poly(ethylene terephthalate) hydrolase family protein [Methylobacterium sp. ID0610]|uniref:poly(ethylene terephthalate) hydrolase family protein n=1 Tax=Methylobacterium carpenticola TaxID=3344827 RepID=UPI0036BEA7C4
MRPTLRTLHALLLTLGLAAGAGEAGAATPPAQPKDGPGGAAYAAQSVVKRALGRAGAVTFAFYGNGAAPAAGRPVVVFLHAWGATNPQSYGSWIEHLAREGYLVLFPRFQEVNRTRPADASATAAALIKEALDGLAGDAEAKPDLARVALIGHLAGVPIAANIAAHAAETGLPVPKLVFGAMPGGIARDDKSRGIALHDLGRIDPATLVITIIGDRDARAADIASRRLMRESTAVTPERKLLMRALSDDHGFPALSATLASPAGVNAAYDAGAIKLPPEPPKDPKQKPPPFKWSADMALTGEQTTLVAQINAAGTDSLDYLAYWKTFDMAAAAAFAGQDAASLKANSRFTDMERWSDGWPVKRLAVETPRPPAERPAATATTTKPTAPKPAEAKPGAKPAGAPRP